jgi:hypothetical protein
MQKAQQEKMDLKYSPLWKPNKCAMTKGKKPNATLVICTFWGGIGTKFGTLE